MLSTIRELITFHFSLVSSERSIRDEVAKQIAESINKLSIAWSGSDAGSLPENVRNQSRDSDTETDREVEARNREPSRRKLGSIRKNENVGPPLPPLARWNSYGYPAYPYWYPFHLPPPGHSTPFDQQGSRNPSLSKRDGRRQERDIRPKKKNRESRKQKVSAPPPIESSDSNGDESARSSSASEPRSRRSPSQSRRRRHRSRRPVWEWNLRYDGKDNGQNLIKFIKEVEYYANSENVSERELFRSAIYLFKDQAKVWFLSGMETEEFTNWKELVHEMKREFLSPDHDHRNEVKAIARKQGPKESFQEFLAEMQKIFNSLTKPLSEGKKFEIVWRNLRSDYKGHAVASNIDNLADLKKFGRQLDATYWFKYANPIDNNPRNRREVNEIKTGAIPKYPPPHDSKKEKSRTFTRTRPEVTSEDERSKRRGLKEVVGQENRTRKEKDAGLEMIVRKYVPPEKGICFNCRLRGHHFEECEGLPHKFCQRYNLKGQVCQENSEIPANKRQLYPDLSQYGLRPIKEDEYGPKEPEVDELFMQLQGDDRPFAEISIFDCPIIGLLDSGAHRSILGIGARGFVKKLKLKIFPSELELRTANGQKLAIEGVVNLPVTFNGSTKIIETLIAPELKRKLILGTDFWKAFNITPTVQALHVEEMQTVLEKNYLNEEQLRRLEKVKSLFKVAEDGRLDETPLITHRVELSQEAKKCGPIRINPFPTSPKRQQQISEEIDNMLKAGIIEKSYSDWALRLVPVDKSDGTVRLCLDARKLNELTVRDSYPLPHADRILSRLGPCKFISTVDLSKAFLQIPLHPKSRKFTAFSVLGRGLFQFRRLPMGMANSSACLARLMDKILGSGELEPNVFVYLDDIIVLSNTLEEHLELLQEVASRLNTANLSINLPKSKFCVPEVTYLGYVLSSEGLRPNPDRVEAILNIERPTSLRSLRRFLGMCNYYRRFIANYSEIVRPLTELLKDKPKSVRWNPEAETSFVRIKELLISAPILTNPDFTKPFAIHCDASDTAVAGVLTQTIDDLEKPIAYYSHKLGAAQQRYFATEKEALAKI
ncbi:uncharacterized protein LOC129743243 [Uranotaenia lowii]|uniref:uncharacterized protein LOC129743243 n=1 Tax=Uranotaenia lowii TaxID=190385 RepID=UPI00247A0A49|nr:uncharacterized protein LOC129743243 [Uranotaenia lowii]